MSPEWEPLLLPGVVREGGLEEVTSEWGFAEIPDQVEEEEQGVALLRLPTQPPPSPIGCLL